MIVADTSFWIAVIALVGVVVGALITVGGNVLLHWLQDRQRRELDAARKKILTKMLNDPRFPERWRKITTLTRVIGTDAEIAKRLLIELGARGSERDDGLWGLIEHHPLNKADQ